ncbi:MAG: calcium/sodium antiporter [Phycisphaeraceae bacterium]|nr:calcium/sodium antiporter [Phycisphaeraceae bacterium]
MLLDLLLLVVSLVLLTLGAEALVRGAVVLALRMGVSSFFVGLTIVGFGTSAPELAAGIGAALKNKPDINIGNVVGSNILNIALILGVASLIRPTPVQTKLVKAEAWVVIGLSLLAWVFAYTGSIVSRWEGVVFLSLLAIHLVRGYIYGRRDPNTFEEVASSLPDAHVADRPAPDAPPAKRLRQSTLFNIGLVVVGLLILTGSSKLLIDSASSIARSLGVSELAIALTIIAGGTSMPELATSVVAAIRKQSDIAIGNILGSNIFNIACILGVTSLIRPPAVNEQVLWLDAPLMILLAIALLPIMLTGARISRAEGAALLVVLVGYIVVLFTLAPKWFGEPAPDPTPAMSPVAFVTHEPETVAGALERAGFGAVRELAPGVLVARSPYDAHSLDLLEEAGVRSVLSVEAWAPDEGEAERRAILVAHVPLRYSGVDEPTRLRVARAVRDLPRPLLVTCETGRDRAAAAVALAFITLGERSTNDAVTMMLQARAAPSNRALFASVRDARPATAADLTNPAMLLADASPNDTANAMSRIDRAWRSLVPARGRDWERADHDDPRDAADRIASELGALAAATKPDIDDEAYRHELRDAALFASLLRDALDANNAPAASAQYGRLAAACTRCHGVYRDVLPVR